MKKEILSANQDKFTALQKELGKQIYKEKKYSIKLLNSNSFVKAVFNKNPAKNTFIVLNALGSITSCKCWCNQSKYCEHVYALLLDVDNRDRRTKDLEDLLKKAESYELDNEPAKNNKTKLSDYIKQSENKTSLDTNNHSQGKQEFYDLFNKWKESLKNDIENLSPVEKQIYDVLNETITYKSHSTHYLYNSRYTYEQNYNNQSYTSSDIIDIFHNKLDELFKKFNEQQKIEGLSYLLLKFNTFDRNDIHDLESIYKSCLLDFILNNKLEKEALFQLFLDVFNSNNYLRLLPSNRMSSIIGLMDGLPLEDVVKSAFISSSIFVTTHEEISSCLIYSYSKTFIPNLYTPFLFYEKYIDCLFEFIVKHDGGTGGITIHDNFATFAYDYCLEHIDDIGYEYLLKTLKIAIRFKQTTNSYKREMKIIHLLFEIYSDKEEVEVVLKALIEVLDSYDSNFDQKYINLMELIKILSENNILSSDKMDELTIVVKQKVLSHSNIAFVNAFDGKSIYYGDITIKEAYYLADKIPTLYLNKHVSDADQNLKKAKTSFLFNNETERIMYSLLLISKSNPDLCKTYLFDSKIKNTFEKSTEYFTYMQLADDLKALSQLNFKKYGGD